jgi:lipoprotein-anchoring transpeptidase ErfK/SrfK
MRAFLFLVVVALAVGGWWFWHKHKQQAHAQADQGEPVLGAGGGATVAPQGGAAQLAPPPGTGSAPADLTPEAKQALDQADALWAKAGADATTGPAAVEIAAAYTQALRAIYTVPGAHEREEALVHDRLAPLGQSLFYSKTRIGDDATGTIAVHVAAPGENPTLIARKYGMSMQFLNRLRGREAGDGNLSVGEALKVVKLRDKGGFAIRVNKSGFYLDCFVAGVFAKRYPVSVGKKESPTPVGRTHLVGREWHPDWTDTSANPHHVYHYGDPGNILGPIWLPFNAQELGQAGIGIHGYTGADSQIGTGASHGCVRLKNDDAEELYNTLSQPDLSPTAVEIVE